MSARIEWAGLDEFKAALRKLPTELALAAGAILIEEANAAKDAIMAAYPARTGNLRNHVIVRTEKTGLYGGGAILKNTAPHAFIFEHGTEVRHTSIGANRGRMPPGHVFIPLAMRHRRRAYTRIATLIEVFGFEVRAA